MSKGLHFSQIVLSLEKAFAQKKERLIEHLFDAISHRLYVAWLLY
ncbi:hypothetical protein A1S_3738 [Acinetobacter baumannii ATCC 17978]|nr:hypothetical protein A1S_3738 [Acinetobacter baumannii ATCC 17978]